MREQILRIIRLHNGIREVDLALAVMSVINPQNFDTDEYHKTINELLYCREINRIQYIERSVNLSSYSIKSIFFTRDIKIMFSSADWSASGKMVGESKGDT